MKLAISVPFYKEGEYRASGREYFCSCGYHNLSKYRCVKYNKTFSCPKCDNEFYFSLDSRYKTKTVKTELIPVDVHIKGFHVIQKKYRIGISYKKNRITVKEIDNEGVRFNLATREFMYIRDGEETPALSQTVDKFFKPHQHHYNFGKILDLISTDINRGLYDFAYNYLSTRNWREYTKKIGTALSRLMNTPHLEIMYFSGFNEIYQLREICNGHGYKTNETKPHKILNVPKLLLKYLKEMNSISNYSISSMKDLFETIGGNNFKTVFDIILEETEINRISISSFCSYFLELYEAYGFKNVSRLATYVCRDVKLQQGIESPSDALNYLRDYARMMTDLGYDFEKYSKSLKKDHDIASMNYKIVGDKVFSERLAEKVKQEEYKVLEIKDKEYSIITPKISDDLIKEGESLSHCVASYVKDVARGLCKILFLRKTESLEESCVTIEVRGKNVKQVRGKGNRLPTQDEKEFIKKWAEKRKLAVHY